MIRKIVFTFIITFIFCIQPILAQQKACKSADIAYERKQYNTAIERYKKALKKNSKKKKSIRELLDLLNMITDLVKVVVSRFFRHLRIRVAKIHITVATGDAATTAIGYGAVTQAINVLFPLLESVRNFPKLRKADIAIRADFEKEEPETDIRLAFSIRIWQILHIAFGALFTLIRHKLKSDEMPTAEGHRPPTKATPNKK